MARRRFIPDRGDFIWIDLNPRAGREQAGHRPALVLSPKAYNRKTGVHSLPRHPTRERVCLLSGPYDGRRGG